MKLKASGRGVLRLSLVLVVLLSISTSFAHPDLILQIEALGEQLSVDPDNTELLVKRGDLYRRHEDFENAARDFEAARAADPNYPATDLLEARLLLDIGQPEPAGKMLSRYLSLRPGHAFAWVLRGRANVRLGQFENAYNDFTTAIAISEKPSPEIYRLQILSLAAQGDDHPGRTLEAVKDGLNRFPYEMSLRGLGVDIALAHDRPETAKELIIEIPEGVRKLPQWSERIETTGCLENSDTQIREACLNDAQLRLKKQFEQFLSGT